MPRQGSIGSNSNDDQTNYHHQPGGEDAHLINEIAWETIAYQPDQCWYLERVPSILEGPGYLLQNAKEVVTFGRRVSTNDKICNGPNVSRNHLKFVRNGLSSDWQTIRWSVVDLGSMVGTFVNRNKIEPNNPFGLNCGDLIGIGCPEDSSSKDAGKETFVYRLKSPCAFHAQVLDVAGPVLEEDAPTPPPSPGNYEEEENNLPLPDLVRRETLSAVAHENNLAELENEGVLEGMQVVVKEKRINELDNVVEDKNVPTVTNLDNSADGGQLDLPVQRESKMFLKRNMKHLLSSSDEDLIPDAKITRYVSTKFRPVFCSLPYLKVPDRAVGAQLIPGHNKVARWELM